MSFTPNIVVAQPIPALPALDILNPHLQTYPFTAPAL